MIPATQPKIESEVQLIPWSEFQTHIAPMWGVGDPSEIPIINNPYRVISYPLDEWPTSIIHFPFRYIEDGVTVGYTCLYNVSDEVIRVRGIYVLPEHRGRGVGHRMLDEGMKLFPNGFRRLVGFFREENVERFRRHSRFTEVPGLDWFWSAYQSVRIRMMYRDRDPGPVSPGFNRAFITSLISEYGIGGTNNLARNWEPDEWRVYAEPHALAYPDGGINLDF